MSANGLRERAVARAVAGGRLNEAEALALFDLPLVELGHLAHLRRLRHHPEPVVTYVVDRNINYSNICISRCRFCAFWRDESAPDAYVLTEEELARKIEEAFLKAGYDSPLEDELCRTLGAERGLFEKVLRSLYDQKKLVRLNPKVTYHAETIASMKTLVQEHLKRKGSIEIAELRDSIKLSRKYAQAVLEYFDRIGLTRRVEDRHVLK